MSCREQRSEDRERATRAEVELQLDRAAAVVPGENATLDRYGLKRGEIDVLAAAVDFSDSCADGRAIVSASDS